ncbi:FERM domain-containing protein [Aphelenchoides besseyi]|nr:FERM domain-containing protein [Aphelenchoides besseyi]
MAPSGTEMIANDGTRTVIQEGIREKDRHMASVTLLDGQRLDVQVHKNAEGEILFNLVCNSIELIEKDYFSLAFYDQNSTRKWLYKNKKISKQVKDLPWEFTLEVKFYTPEPQDLREDFTRHLLTLQLRADLYNGKLPAAFANQARFGSLIAQAELGDYKPEHSYEKALRALNIVKHITPELSETICKFYKDQKGKTPPEAELSFLLACRENAMYGMSIYNAKERSQPVRIGINAHGISVFSEQLRTHYVVWQSMHQLEYQRKTFTIKLKPGEKEGKNNLVFKLDDEGSAKRCWKTAVDHHTFFRLLQPADKHNSLFSFGSTRRPEGRTLIQAKMASQMFDGTPTAPQMSSARVVSQSPENPTYQAASPVEEGRVIMESTTTRTYHIETREPTSPRSDAFNGTTDEVGEISVSPDAPPRHALHASSDKPLFVSTAASEHLDGTRTSSRCYTITESLSLPQQQFSPGQQSMQQSIKFGTENEARLLQRGDNLPTSFSTTPTLLSSAWFAKQRQRRLLTMSSAQQPTPTSEVRSPVDSAQFTTVVTSPIPRSTTTSPYSHLIQTPDPGEQLLPIVREINQQMTTTLMSLPSRSHTVLAEYLSTADTSHLSNELIAAYRSLLTACGDTPAQADLKIREATSTRVYCRRSPLSPLTLNTPLPADVEDVLRTRSPSPTVRFDETVNHCIRITGVDNNASLYQYNVSAAEASRAKIRGGYSPNRQAYTSLTREEANIKTTDYTTPKRKLFGRRKQKSSPFVRNEFAPTVGISREFDVQEVPLRYHSAVYHSGYSTRFPYLSERDRFAGDEEMADVSAENEQKYPLIGEASGSAERLEKSEELDGRNLRQYVRVYYRDKQHRGFSKPTAILHMRHQQRQRDQHTHKNGHAQIDLSPVPRYETLAIGENENQKVRRYRIFTRERHEGIEQIIEEVDLSAYPTLQEPGQQEEPVETLKRIVEVDIQPLKEHSTAYHSGESYTPREQTPRYITEETTPRSKQTAVLHLKKKREEKAKKTKTKREFFKRKQEETSAKDDLQSPSTSNPPISEPYEGPYNTVNPDEQLTSLPLRSHVQSYHSGYSITSTNRRYRFFTRERHPGEEETIEPDVDRYNLDSTEFEGPLETVAIDNRELQKAPLKQHSNVYHSGHSFVRTKQVGKKKVPVDSSSESGFEEEPEDTHGKRTARLVIKSEVVEQPEVSTEKRPLFGFLRSGKKSRQSEQSTYPSASERYEGELENVPKTTELASSPLRENVDVVHEFKYKQLVRKQKIDANEELAENKKTAQLHVKSEFTEIPEEKTEERKPLFGFLKGKKDVLPPTSYLTSEVWKGEVTPLNKNNELDGHPIRNHVDQFYEVFYSASSPVSETTKDKSKLVIHTKSTITEESEDKPPPKESEKHHLFGFLHKNRHGKSEDQSPTQSTAYPSIGEKWEGEFEKIEKTKDIDNLPILSQVERVHDVAYHFLAGDGHKTEPSTSTKVEEEQRQGTAVIHAKTTIIEEDQPQKPEEGRHSSFFGFRRGKKELVTEEHTKLSYPLNEPYYGELEQLPKIEELNISPIRKHVDKINEVAYSPLVKSKQKTDDRQSPDEAQKQAALIHAKTTINESPERVSSTEEHRGTLFGFLKTKKHTDEKVSPVSSYPELSEKYEGDYIALTPTEFSTLPLREIVETVHDVPYSLKKKPQTPAGYPAIGERFEGEHDHLRPHEFDRTPLRESVDAIHDVPYSTKKDDHSQYPPIGERYDGELDVLRSNEVDGLPLRESVDQIHDVAYETEVHKTALIHAKTTDVELIEDEETESPKAGKRKLFGFLSGKKEHHDEKMSAVSSYPELGDRFEGVYEELSPTEFATLPLRETVETVHDVPYSLKKEDRSRYPPIGGKFEGEHDLLESTELISSPLKEHVDQIYDSENLQPRKIEEVETHKTAVIHAKTTVVEVPEDHERRKSSLLGFLRSSKKSPEHNRSLSPYSYTSEQFEGELFDLPKVDELSVVPLNQHVDILHDVPYKSSAYSPKLVASEEQEEPKKVAQLLVKSEVVEVTENEDRKPIFGFLHGKKKQSSKNESKVSSTYPTTELWEGDVDLLSKPDEMIGSPLSEHVDQIHDISQLLSGDVKEDVSTPTETEAHKQTAVIHAKSTVIEVSEDSKDEGKPKLSGLFRGKKAKTVKEEDLRSKSPYPTIGEKYEGSLDVLEPTEITTSPLHSLVNVYDFSYDKTPKVVAKDEVKGPIEPEHKQTAVIYAKSTVIEDVDLPKPKKSRKKKKVSSSYPRIGEVFIGEHDVLQPTEMETNPLKSFVEQIRDVSHPQNVTVEKSEVQQTEEPKQTARIVMKSTNTEIVDTPKLKESKLFGFLKTKKGRASEEERPIVYPTNPPFEGPYDTVNPDEQLTSLPLRSHVQPYHSGYSITSTNRRYRFFTRERHPGEEETIEPDVDRYNLDSTEFEGPLETVAIDNRELQKAPLKQHSNVYHSGHSFVRTKQVGKKKVPVDSSSESGFEEEPEDTHGKRTARLVIKSEVVEQPEVSTEKRPLFGFLRSGKKSRQSEQSTYPSASERYEGELENVPKTFELASSPLRENVDVVHEIAELPQQPKKVAQLHIKSEIVEVPEEEHKPLFGFLKKQPKKEEEKPSTSPLPTIGERYEGPLEPLGSDEFNSTPLTDYVDQIIEVDYPSPKRSPKKIEKEPTDEAEESKKIAQLHVKSEDVEVRESEERKPLFGFLRGKKEHDEKVSPVSSYPELSEKYEGDYIALTPTEFSTLPLREIVETVHDVAYSLKKKPQTPAGYPAIGERFEGEHDHLRPHEFDRTPLRESVDAIHDVPYSTKKDDHSQYPPIGERYDGEHDLLESNEFDTSPLKDHVDKIHDIPQSPVGSPRKVAQEVIDEHKATAQVHVKSEVVEEMDTERRRKSQLFGFLHGKKQRKEDSRYPTIGEKFEGQPDILNNEEFASSPIDSHVALIQDAVHPRIQETGVESPADETYGKTAVIHMKSTVVEILEDEKEADKTKLFGFLRGKKEQTTKTEESQASTYPSISQAYEGEIEVLTKPDELPQNIIRNNVNLYHDDLLYAPRESTKADERKQTMRLVVKSEDYQLPEVKEEAQSMFAFLRGIKKTRDSKQPSTSYPSLSERYDGELKHVEVIHDVFTKSKLRIPKIEITDESETAKKTAQLHIKSEVFEVPAKEERMSTIETKKHRRDKEDDQTADLSKYPQVVEAWEGEYDMTHKFDEIDSSPLHEHVEQIHNLAYPKSTPVPQEVDLTEAPTHKATAIIRTRSTIVEAPESKSAQKHSQSKLFGFLRNKTEKSDESKTVDYPVQEKWEGEIELLDRPEELNKTAINDHANIYHSGAYKRLPNKTVEATEIVEPKQTARLVVKSEDIESPEAMTHEDKLKPLFGFLKSKKEDTFYSSNLEPYTGQLGSLTKTDELIATPLKEHVDYIAEVPYIFGAKEVPVEDIKQRKTAVIHTKTTLNDEPTESSTDGKSKLFGFWSGKKQPKEKEESSYSSYPTIGERWEGEVHPEHRIADFIHSPILEHVENVGEMPPYTTITSKQTIVTEGDQRRTLTFHTTSTIVETTEPKSKDSEQHKRFGFIRGHRQSKTDELPSFYSQNEPYTGEYETPERIDDLENRPLRDSVQVYHSGFSPQNHKRYRLFFYERHGGEEELVEKVDEKYNFDQTPYEGLFEEMRPNVELESTTIREYSNVYHHGSSFEQKPRSARRKEVEVSSESEDEESRPKSSAHLTVKSKEYEELEVEQPKEGSEHKLFGFIRGYKRDELPSAYPTTEKWEGPVDDISKFSEIEITPLRSHVNVYEFSYSPVNVRQKKKKSSVISEDDSNRKKTAAITTKSTVTEDVGDQNESSPFKLLGFLRKKEQCTETEHSDSKYPPISEVFNGELDIITKPDELLDSPIREHVDIVHDFKYKSSMPSPQPIKTEVVEEPRSIKKIAQLHVKSEIFEVPESEVTPARKPLFGFLKKQHHDKNESELISPTSDYPTSEQWEGELQTVTKDTELPGAQLRDYANAYLDDSYSTTKSEVGQPKQAARLYVKSEVVELPEGKQASSNRKPFFGFRQQKKGEDSQQSKYPAIEEQWNGEPEAMNINEFDASPLREHVELVHTTDYPDKSLIQKVEMTKEKPKQTARIVMKSTNTEIVDTPKLKESKLFGFLKTKKGRASEEERPIVYPTSPPFEGPYDTVNPDEQLTSLPLRSHVQSYHSGYSITSTNRRYRFFTRERHPGEEETIEPDVDRYNLDSTEFEGPLETVAIDNRELQKAPLKQHSNVYHSGHSFVRTKQVGKKKVPVDSSSESGFEEEPEDTHGKRTARLVIKSEVVEQPEVSTEKRPLFGFLRSGKKSRQSEQSTYPSASERYEGELENVPKTTELASSPLRENVDVVHEIAELPQQPKKVAQLHIKSEIVEVPEEEHKPLFGFLKKQPKKEEEKPSTSPLPTIGERYEGPLETLRSDEFNSTPLTDYVDQIIEVDYPSPKRSPKKIEKEPTDEAEESKKIAQLHVKSEDVEVRESEERKPLFGFLRGKKEHDEKVSPVSSYPELSEKYEGDYIALTPTEFSTLPLREIVETVHDVPYSLKKKPQTPAGYPAIGERFEGEYDHLRPHEFDRTPLRESVDAIHDVPYSTKKDDHSQYPPIGERYDGELDVLRSNEVDGLPLRESVDQIHDVAYETEVHKTALIHAKTTDVELIEDEETESPKAGKRKLFGFLSGKKEHHDEKMSAVSSYPELGDRFEGVYEELSPTEFATLPLRETVETVHDVPYSLKKEDRSRYPPIGGKFEGEHDLLESTELISSPLKEHVDQIYDSENLQPRKIEEVETHKTAVIHAKTTVVEVPEDHERRKSSLLGFLRSSSKKSPEHNRSLSPYSYTSEQFEGELFDLPKVDELSVVPLNQHVDILHDVPYKSSAYSPKLVASEEQEEPKKVAQLLVKSEVVEVTENEDRKPIFGFLHGKKKQSSKNESKVSSTYPTTELWEGDVDLLSKPDEMIGSPLSEHVDQIHDISQLLSGDVKEDVSTPTETEAHKQTAVIHTKSTFLQMADETPKRSKKSKISGKKDAKNLSSSGYQPIDKRWEGEVADAKKSNEMVASPLREHVEQVHDSPYNPTKMREDQSEIRRSTKSTAILHLIRREKPQSETTTKSQVDEQKSIESPSRKKAKRTSKIEEQQPSTSALTEDDVDVGLVRKPVARLLLRSSEEDREVQSKVRKPGTRGLMQRLFRKRRTPFDVRNAAVRAGKDESSELVAVMSIGDASFFITGSDVRNVEVNLFARRLATAAYHVEILIADLATRTFPVLFDGRRGPMCLPISYMNSTVNRVSFTTFGHSTSGGGLNGNLLLEEREDEEADGSSMASATIETDRSHKKHKRHHRSAPSDAANDGKPQSTDRKSQHFEQSIQMHQISESDKKHKEKTKSKHDTSSSSNSSVEVEERHHILHGETDNTKRNSLERSAAISTEFATHNDQTTIIKHTNEQLNGWETTESPSTEISDVVRLPSDLGQTVLPLSSSPNKPDEFVEESETISSKVVTTGNRTVETITYTTTKDGVQNTRVEHRVTVNPSEADSEAALKRAIAESTGLSSRYQVQGLSVPIHSIE